MEAKQLTADDLRALEAVITRATNARRPSELWSFLKFGRVLPDARAALAKVKGE